MNQKYLKKVALALRNNSKLLREEANVIRNSNNQKIPGYLETWNNTTNELEILRNNSKLLWEEAHAIRKTSINIRNESKVLIEEAQALTINSKLLREETQALRNARNQTKMINEKIPSNFDRCNTTNELQILKKRGTSP